MNAGSKGLLARGGKAPGAAAAIYVERARLISPEEKDDDATALSPV